MKKIILAVGIIFLAGCGPKTPPEIPQAIPQPIPKQEDVMPPDTAKSPGQPQSNWQLVSGDPNDTCTKPTFKGEATVKGWYAYEDIYVETKDWVFNVVKADAIKLPKIYDANTKKYINFEKFIISDATPALKESLKKYTKENPGEITIKSYSLYCEGLPSASIGSPTENKSGVIYKNEKYGFQITLPDEWEKYKVDIDDKQVATTGAVYVHFLIPTTDKTWPGTFLTDGTKLNGYADVFAISVWNKSEWDKQIDSKECKENPTPDCPYGGSMIGFTNQYVFDISRGNGIVPNDILGKLNNIFKKTGSLTAEKAAGQNLSFQLLIQ